MKSEDDKNKNENQESIMVRDQQTVPTNNYMTPNNIPVSLYQTQKYIAVPLTVAEARPLLPVVLVNGKDLDSPEKHGYPPLPASATANFQFPQQQQFNFPQQYPSVNAKTDSKTRQFSSRQLNYANPSMYPSSPYNMAATRVISPRYKQPTHTYARQIPQSSQHKETLTHALNHPPFFVPKSITAAIKQKQQALRDFRPSGYPGDYYEK
ncbi:hypothetical protein M8J75_007276 [Diaphorina citri]|nr:hypothetical protein M8J75_007276 [Diaphorina citri]KAI5731267.1 hypothetical protein M8J77_007214 [Diaphorina citri]